MSLILQDSSLGLWLIQTNDNGILLSTSVGSGSPTTLILNDSGSTVSWQVKVNTSGILQTTEVSLGVYPTTYLITSMSGLTFWNLSVLTSGILQTTQTSAYSISGNAGITGATLSYAGTSSGSVVSGAGGTYTIPGLSNGTYTITPSLAGYTFSPNFQVVVVNNSNVTGINFTATPNGGGGGNVRPWYGPKLAASLRGIRG